MFKSIATFFLGIKRSICKRNIIIFFLVSIAAIYAFNNGFDEFTINLDRVREFKNIEISIFNTITNYKEISNFGFDVYLMPAASGILFSHPALFTIITANINTIVTLKMYSILQSSSIFQTQPIFQFRLSTILLFLGTLLAISFGYEAINSLNEPDYLKSIISVTSKISVYFSIIASRFVLLVISYLTIFFLILGLMAIKGIHLTQSDIAILPEFLIIALLTVLFFFLLGTICGHIRNGLGNTVILTTWIVLVIGAPIIIDSIIQKKANEISSYYKKFNDKLSVVNDFEKKTEKEKGKYIDNTPASRKKIIEDYWNNDYKIIEKNDEQYKEEFKQVIKFSNNLYNLLPSTFYLSTANEASSQGYQNFLDFYTYLMDLRRQYVRFWIDRVYYNDPKILVNFVKGDENIFKAKSQLPFNFRQGVFINSLYCIILLFLSYFLYIRALFPAPKKAKELKKVSFKVNVPGIFTEIKSSVLFINYFLNVFFGQIRRFTGKFVLFEKDIVNRHKKDFLYIPAKESIPKDLNVKQLLNHFKQLLKPTEDVYQKLIAGLDKTILEKTFAEIDDLNKALVLLKVPQMKKFPVLIINDIAKGISLQDQEKIRAILQDFRVKDFTIFNFSSDDTYIVYKPNKVHTFHYENGEYCDYNQKQNEN